MDREDKEKLRLIEEVLAHKAKIDKEFDTMYVLFGNAEGSVFDAVYKAFDSYVDAVSTIIGDWSGRLAWYIWENDMGKKGLKVSINRITVAITSPKLLLKLIKSL